jgi:hypothetical protein
MMPGEGPGWVDDRERDNPVPPLNVLPAPLFSHGEDYFLLSRCNIDDRGQSTDTAAHIPGAPWTPASSYRELS